jgi:hypothetical protein
MKKKCGRRMALILLFLLLLISSGCRNPALPAAGSRVFEDDEMTIDLLSAISDGHYIQLIFEASDLTGKAIKDTDFFSFEYTRYMNGVPLGPAGHGVWGSWQGEGSKRKYVADLFTTDELDSLDFTIKRVRLKKINSHMEIRPEIADVKTAAREIADGITEEIRLSSYSIWISYESDEPDIAHLINYNEIVFIDINGREVKTDQRSEHDRVTKAGGVLFTPNGGILDGNYNYVTQFAFKLPLDLSKITSLISNSKEFILE